MAGCPKPLENPSSAAYVRPYGPAVTDTAGFFGIETAKRKEPNPQLPSWLTKKPRTLRGRREAAQWASSRGVELPFEGWREWLDSTAR